MNKKSRIIMWVIIGLMLVATAAVIFINAVNGGASKITYDKFVEYVERNAYTQDGTNVVDKNGDVVENYRFESGTLQYFENDAWKDATIISKVAIDQYKISGYVGKVLAVYCYGPSFYSSPADGSVVEGWREMGVTIEYEDPNAGSIWSSVFSLGGIVL
ncbi:MAG: hypothetical protein MJ091_07190, partial [Clostridia bacterium]|nr:hypothetical protein [Clostridia bacterium]